VPTYQYACTDCGDKSEVVQRFTDDPLTVCAVCGGKLRKVFSPVGIVFKGSGFYRNDSRDGTRKVPAAKEGAASESNGSSGDGAATGSASAKESSSNGSSDGGSAGSSTSSAGEKKKKNSSVAASAAS
jgi:putative FmdB family regulatory protein